MVRRLHHRAQREGCVGQATTRFEIETLTGAVYRYYDVPVVLHRNLLATESR
jgi:hypothetical protein